MPSLELLLDQREKRLERQRNAPKPVPLREHRDYSKYFTWLEAGKFSKGEISTQLLHAGLDAAVLDQDPSKPLGWKPGDDEEKRPKSAPPPVTNRSKPGLKAVFDMSRRPRAEDDSERTFPAGDHHHSPAPQNTSPETGLRLLAGRARLRRFDGGSGAMDTKKLGGCLHKLGVKSRSPASKTLGSDDTDATPDSRFDDGSATSDVSVETRAQVRPQVARRGDGRLRRGRVGPHRVRGVRGTLRHAPRVGRAGARPRGRAPRRSKRRRTGRGRGGVQEDRREPAARTESRGDAAANTKRWFVSLVRVE